MCFFRLIKDLVVIFFNKNICDAWILKLSRKKKDIFACSKVKKKHHVLLIKKIKKLNDNYNFVSLKFKVLLFEVFCKFYC